MAELNVEKEQNVFNPNSISFNERQKELEQQEQQERELENRRKKSPFSSFVQVNKEMYKAEDWLMAKSPIAYRIFKFLINNMDGYNAVICSQAVLQETFDVSRTTVSRAIKLLKEKGYIAIFKSGTSNVYAVNDKIVWNSWGTNYAYSKFPANVILSMTEQEDNVQKKIKAVKHKEVIIKE